MKQALVMSCVILSSSAFAQDSVFNLSKDEMLNQSQVGDFNITNESPQTHIENRIEWTNPEIKLSKKENIPENCIGHGSEWRNCITVETSSVIPQSSIESTALKPIVLPAKDKVLETVGTTQDEVIVKSISDAITLAAYPDNIEKYKAANGVTTFTNDRSTITPGTKTIKVDLNKLPESKNPSSKPSKVITNVKSLKENLAKKDVKKVQAKKLNKELKKPFKSKKNNKVIKSKEVPKSNQPTVIA